MPTGALLERLNFGLTLASNRIPGTRVNLKQFLGGETESLDKSQIMDRFLGLIVAGDIAPRTKEALLKQLNEQAPLVAPATTRETAVNRPMGDEMTSQPPLRQRQPGNQLARSDASITDPVTKIVGLILPRPNSKGNRTCT